MRHHKHLTLYERKNLRFRRAKGYSITAIAKSMGRNKSGWLNAPKVSTASVIKKLRHRGKSRLATILQNVRQEPKTA